MKEYEKIKKLMARGCEILGSDYALIGGAMTWISESNLVSAMSNAGMFGVLASGAMNGDQLKEEITLTKSKTNRNFGVNIILMNPRLHDLLDVCGEKKVSHLVLAGGIPDRDLLKKISAYGMKAFSFAPSLSVAKRLFKYGIDALILEGNEAGGHIGPVSTLVLIQEIMLNMREYPIFIAGGILRGEIFSCLLQLGAVGCQLGTVFACAQESLAHKTFKKALLRASARDAVASIQIDKKFPVTPVRTLENHGTNEFLKKQMEIFQKFEANEISLEEGRLSLEHFWSGALKRAVLDGDVARGSVMSGQIVGIVNEEKTIADILDVIFAEAEKFLAGLDDSTANGDKYAATDSGLIAVS
ncbi:MAG: nitronate monooxygenase [Holosporaceae bacterium]|jgi:enoyl-[acyl-carrier protein] reductase II|nr:nitronate monooxygenase [Holosporaceae bacterium]